MRGRDHVSLRVRRNVILFKLATETVDLPPKVFPRVEKQNGGWYTLRTIN